MSAKIRSLLLGISLVVGLLLGPSVSTAQASVYPPRCDSDGMDWVFQGYRSGYDVRVVGVHLWDYLGYREAGKVVIRQDGGSSSFPIVHSGYVAPEGGYNSVFRSLRSSKAEFYLRLRNSAGTLKLYCRFVA